MKRLPLIGLVTILVLVMMGLANPVGRVRSFQISCTTSATLISDSLPIAAQRIWNNSATLVYLGGLDVDTTTHGMPICTTAASCIASNLPMDGKPVYCIVGAASQTVTVIAGS